MLFPDDGITKGDLFDVLRPRRRRDRAAPARPAVHDEALARGARRAARSSRSRRRRGCPTGSRRAQFRTWPRGGKGESRLVDFPLVNSREALLWMVQMHCIDMNAWYSRVDKPDRPDFVLFDLDPPEEPDAFALCVRVAHYVHERARRARARVVREDERRGRDPRRSSRSRGASTYEDTYEFAELLSRRLEARASGRGDDRVAEEEAVGRARRPPPERPREDDRVGRTRCVRSRARRSRRRFAGTS